MQVEVRDEGQCGLCGLPCVRVIECGQLIVLEDGDRLVFESGFYHPALVVYLVLLIVLLDEALLLPRCIPCWYAFHYYQVGWDDEGGVCSSNILLGCNDNPNVPISPSTDVTLGLRRILH